MHLALSWRAGTMHERDEADSTIEVWPQLVPSSIEGRKSPAWLMPRPERFHQLHPEGDVNLVTSERGLGALPSETNVAIVFGDGRSRHGETHLLFHQEVYPVCSARLLKEQTAPLSPTALSRLPLLHLRPESRSRWLD